MSSPTTLQEERPLFQARSRTKAALAAFQAIFLRDLLVAWQDLPTFLLQMLLQPLFLLFIFGKVLPGIGIANPMLAVILLPGVIALTILLTALQSMAIDLSVDLGFLREIDDRLLAPIPVSLVAIEKVLFAALRALFAGMIIFPLAFLILGNGYQVRVDLFGATLALMALTALMAATMGLILGVVTPATKIQLTFSLILTPLLFTGCTYYPWFSLSTIRWFQIVTLFNPLTYASEGLRYTMVPPVHGHPFQTLAIGWILLMLGGTCAVCLGLGIKLFRQRVIG